MEDQLRIVGDQTLLCIPVVERFSREGYTGVPTGNGREARTFFQRNPFSPILADFRMPAMNGSEFLNIVKAVHPKVMGIVRTPYPGFDIVVRVLRMEAFDLEFMVFTVKKALVRGRPEDEPRAYRQHLEQKVQSETQVCRKLTAY